MGAGIFTIIWKVLLVEARTSLIVGVTIALGTILGYSAMAGAVGGGGLGNIAIMPYGELYTSLQNGLITATDQQIPSYIIENYYEVAPFYSYVGAQWTSYSLMMNLDKFNQHPPYH